MKVRRALQNLAKIVAEEAEHNPEFESRLRDALGLNAGGRAKLRPRSSAMVSSERTKRRPRHRRPPALFDPVVLARESEGVLREQLVQLTVEQLKDIVADYGMDPGKLVMKWKSSERIIDRIVEVSVGRARKGNAFR